MSLWPRVPSLLKDIRSQFKTRLEYLLASPMFLSDIEYTLAGETGSALMHMQSAHYGIYGSYDNRLIKGDSLFIKVANDLLTSREWVDPRPWIAWVSPKKYLILNPPKLKIRPFPGETFELRITLPDNGIIRIPYVPTQIRR